MLRTLAYQARLSESSRSGVNCLIGPKRYGGWAANSVRKVMRWSAGLALKQRPVEKGLILWAGDIEQFDFLLLGPADGQLAKIALSWPGANTRWCPIRTVCRPDYRHTLQLPCAFSSHPLIRQTMCRMRAPGVDLGLIPAVGKPPHATRCGSNSIFTRIWMRLSPVHCGPSAKSSIIGTCRTDQINPPVLRVSP